MSNTENSGLVTKPSNPKDVVGSNKVPFSYVSAPVMLEVANGMLEGGLKYGRHNYRAVGVRASIYYDATMRHLMAWWEGEDEDGDLKISHVTKAICSLVVLRDSMLQGNWVDDRPPQSRSGWVEEYNGISASIVARYPAPVAPYTQVDVSWINLEAPKC